MRLFAVVVKKMFANPILPISKAESKYELLNPIMMKREEVMNGTTKSLTLFGPLELPPATIKAPSNDPTPKEDIKSPYP